MNLDYFKAAERDISSLPLLKKSIDIMKKRQERLIQKGAPREPAGIDFEKPYSDSKSVNDTLGELLAIAELRNEIRDTQEEIAEIEAVLAEIPNDLKTVIELFYMRSMSAEKIAEKIYVESEKTVYNLRNKGVAMFAVIYYGAAAKKTEKLGKK